MLTGHQLDVDLDPGSAEWLATVSASQIAAILGLSPWQTPHSLWHLKAGTMPAEEQTDAMGRGHEFEPLIRNWYAAKHPEWIVAETGTWQHNLRTWQTASPDALLIPDNGEMFPEQEPTELLEIKTTADMREWNEGIPDYYGVQGMWQLDTLGLQRVTFAVCGPFELFDRRPKEYVLEYDPRVAAQLREAAIRFMESLELGIEPDPDYTTEPDRLALRWQHTEIRDEGLEIPDEIAVPYLTALAETNRIDGDKARWSAELAAFLGDRKKATWNGHTLGTRKNGRGDNPPSFSAAPKLADKAADILNPKASAAA